MSTFWRLVNFDDPLNRWLDLERPELAVRRAVTEWIISAADDAYAGARRQPDVGPDYWRRLGHQRSYTSRRCPSATTTTSNTSSAIV